MLRIAKNTLTDPNALGLIMCSRVGLTMWEGVRDTPWSFLSPPWQLRDKGDVISHRNELSLNLTNENCRHSNWEV
jgi:hypothetical protein